MPRRHRSLSLQLFFGYIALKGGAEFNVSHTNYLICFDVVINEKSSQRSIPISSKLPEKFNWQHNGQWIDKYPIFQSKEIQWDESIEGEEKLK